MFGSTGLSPCQHTIPYIGEKVTDRDKGDCSGPYGYLGWGSTKLNRGGGKGQRERKGGLSYLFPIYQFSIVLT